MSLMDLLLYFGIGALFIVTELICLKDKEKTVFGKKKKTEMTSKEVWKIDAKEFNKAIATISMNKLMKEISTKSILEIPDSEKKKLLKCVALMTSKYDLNAIDVFNDMLDHPEIWAKDGSIYLVNDHRVMVMDGEAYRIYKDKNGKYYTSENGNLHYIEVEDNEDEDYYESEEEQ